MPSMLQAAPILTLPEYGVARRPWLTAFLVLVATLASTIRLKVGPVQYLELIYFAQIFAVFVLFVRRNYHTGWLRPIVWIGGCYLFFCVAAIALAFYALRFHFAYPRDISSLNQPVVIAFVRSTELLLSVFAMLWLADLFRKDLPALRFTLRLYFWTGVLSALFSFLGWLLSLVGIGSFGVLLPEHRFFGFYNEGGPWGLYVLSLLLLGVVLHRLGWEPQRRLLFAMPLLLFGFVMSASKSAFVAAAVLLLFNSLFAGSQRSRITVVSILGIVLLIAAQTLNLSFVLQTLVRSADTYERISNLHSNDGNFVIGRIAGLFIVPRMVAAHPLSGVGWGNYGLLRNLPEYRGASAFTFENDQPALGLLGDAAEFGIPLDLFLLALLLLPFFYLRRLRSPVYLTNLALLQPLVHLFGGQLNLTYPWIATAFALGLAYSAAVPSRTALISGIPPAPAMQLS